MKPVLALLSRGGRYRLLSPSSWGDRQRRRRRVSGVLTASLGVLAGALMAVSCFYELSVSPRSVGHQDGGSLFGGMVSRDEDFDTSIGANATMFTGGNASGSRRHPSILCAMLFSPGKSSRQGVEAVNWTFARRCDKVIYYSTSPRVSMKLRGLPIVVVDEGEMTAGSWDFVRRVLLNLVGEQRIADYDWLFLGDQKTFPIMENLRRFAQREIGGQRLTPIVAGRLELSYGLMGHVFSSLRTRRVHLDAGLLVNRAAVAHIVTAFRADRPRVCRSGDSWFGWLSLWGGGGDPSAQIAECLVKLRVRFADTLDAAGKHRFLPETPRVAVPRVDAVPSTLLGRMTKWMYKDPRCCSDEMLSFGGLSHRDIYLLDYTLYRLNPFGLNRTRF